MQVVLYGLDGVMSERQKVNADQRFRPRELQRFVEEALRQYAEERSEEAEGEEARWWRDLLEHKAYRVWNVTMIAEDRGLLRALQSNVPAERKVDTLRKKRERRLARGEGCCERLDCCADWTLRRAEGDLEKRRKWANDMATRCAAYVHATPPTPTPNQPPTLASLLRHLLTLAHARTTLQASKRLRSLCDLRRRAWAVSSD